MLSDWGMFTSDGDAAVSALVGYLLAEAQAGVDELGLLIRLKEGSALISSMHVEVEHPAVQIAIRHQLNSDLVGISLF
jgi:hypothetical protein